MVYMVVRQLYVIRKEVDINNVFPGVGKGFLFSLAAAGLTELAIPLTGDQILLNGLVFLFSLTALLLWQKPVSEKHLQMIEEIHPTLGMGVGWFVRRST